MKLNKLLLKKNLSPARIAGFVLSNVIGLAIILAGIQFYVDASPIWQDDDSFIKKDYLVVNKRVTSENTLGGNSCFSPEEIADLEAQPWVRSVGKFRSADYRVAASVSQGGRGMQTAMFFESLPDEFVDVANASWRFDESKNEVPIIISKDYLTLYNFGFATSAGLPQMSEQIMSAVPLDLVLQSEDGSRTGRFTGRVVGYSNRLNTILVPDDFMAFANAKFGASDGAGSNISGNVSDAVKGEKSAASRVIIDVSSPGDTAIGEYLEAHDMEIAGDKSASQAAYLLRVVTGIILAVGIVITLLSFFVLILSVSLLIEKSRDKLHTLLELGYYPQAVAAPYNSLITKATIASFLIALGAVYALRLYYIPALSSMAGGSPDPLSQLVMPLIGLVLTILIILFGHLTVRRRVAQAF